MPIIYAVLCVQYACYSGNGVIITSNPTGPTNPYGETPKRRRIDDDDGKEEVGGNDNVLASQRGNPPHPR